MQTTTTAAVTIDQRFEHYARFIVMTDGPRKTAAHRAWSIESFQPSYRPEIVALAMSVIVAESADWDAALSNFMAATGDYGDNYWNIPDSVKTTPFGPAAA